MAEFLASSLVWSCVYTVHVQVCTSGNNELQGPASKPVNQLGRFSLVETCCNTAVIAINIYKYCIEPMNIKEKWNSILTGCATLNDRRVTAFMLHVFIDFIAKHEQEEPIVWLTGDFICFEAVLHLLDRVSCILKRPFYKDKHAVLFSKKMFF